MVARDPRVSRQHLRRCVRLLPQACGSTAAVGREAFIDAKKPFYTACDHMLGLTCQRLGSIGQTGTTVHRDGSMASADRPSRPSGPRIGEDDCRRFFLSCESCCSHLDEPREPSGAMRGPRGRPWRPPDGSDGSDGADGESPGRGKRVKAICVVWRLHRYIGFLLVITINDRNSDIGSYIFNPL